MVFDLYTQINSKMENINIDATHNRPEGERQIDFAGS